MLMTLVALSLICIAVWVTLLRRADLRRRIFGTRFDFDVPWGLTDVLVVSALWMMSLIAASIGVQFLGVEQLKTTESAVQTEPATASPGADDQSNAETSGTPHIVFKHPALVFTVAALASIVTCGLGLGYLFLRYGRIVIDHLGVNHWRVRLTSGLIGFLMVMPPVFWLMDLLVRWARYEHETLTAIADSPTLAVIIATWVSAGIVAPISEEMFFRFVLQSWLQRLRLRGPRLHWLRVIYGDLKGSALVAEAGVSPSLEPKATKHSPLFAIVVSSLLFALVHLGQGPAPIALFVFALGLGTVFYQTGSIVPSITMHMLLNGYSLTFATLAALEGQKVTS